MWNLNRGFNIDFIIYHVTKTIIPPARNQTGYLPSRGTIIPLDQWCIDVTCIFSLALVKTIDSSPTYVYVLVLSLTTPLQLWNAFPNSSKNSPHIFSSLGFSPPVVTNSNCFHRHIFISKLGVFLWVRIIFLML